MMLGLLLLIRVVSVTPAIAAPAASPSGYLRCPIPGDTEAGITGEIVIAPSDRGACATQ